MTNPNSIPREIEGRRTVFVSNYSAHDYSDAQTYGKIFPITSGSLNLLNLDRMLTSAVEAIKNSEAEDFLLISGPPVMCAIALATWLGAHTKCNLLLFDAKERVYVLKTISRNQITTALTHMTESV